MKWNEKAFIVDRNSSMTHMYLTLIYDPYVTLIYDPYVTLIYDPYVTHP